MWASLRFGHCQALAQELLQCAFWTYLWDHCHFSKCTIKGTSAERSYISVYSVLHAARTVPTPNCETLQTLDDLLPLICICAGGKVCELLTGCSSKRWRVFVNTLAAPCDNDYTVLSYHIPPHPLVVTMSRRTQTDLHANIETCIHVQTAKGGRCKVNRNVPPTDEIIIQRHPQMQFSHPPESLW